MYKFEIKSTEGCYIYKLKDESWFEKDPSSIADLNPANAWKDVVFIGNFFKRITVSMEPPKKKCVPLRANSFLGRRSSLLVI